MADDSHKTPGGKVLGRIVLIFSAAVLAGALLAPHLFNFLVFLGRSVPAFEELRNVEFEKIASRCALLSVLVALIPAARVSGLTSFEKLGFRRGRGWARPLGLGLVVGVVSLGVMLAAGILVGAYRLGDVSLADPQLWLSSLSFVVGALLVGYLEELIFRGVIFGMLRQAFRMMPAAMLASVLFSAVHFAQPEPPVGVVYGHWDAGLQMLPHLFTAIDMRWGFGLMSLTLFFMGMTLCLFYSWRGSLYLAVGLHAGWVWAMRTANVFLERDLHHAVLSFGPSMTVAKSGMAVAIMFGFFVVAGVLHLRTGGRHT